MKRLLSLAVRAPALALALLAVPAPARADAPPPTPGGDVDIVEQLGEQVPRALPFVDSAGRAVQLGDYLAGRPVVLALVYHRCLGLCSLLLAGLTTAMRALDWQVGREFDVLTVSIDPDETPALAATSRAGYLQALGHPAPDTRWAFLTGPASSIDALAGAVGFRFQYVEGQRQFAHAAALFVLTPDGRVSRYLYGVEPPPRQLQAALFEASGGRVGTSLDRVILRCFPWDPASRRYHLFLNRYFRGAGLLLLAAVGTLLGVLWRRDLAAEARVNELLRRMLFLPPQASAASVGIDHLHFFVILTTLVVSSVAGVLAVYFMARYRRRRQNQPTPHLEAPRWLEAAFVVVPLSFFLLWFRIGFGQFVEMTSPPPDAMDVYVTGKQWMWKFAYPEGPSGLEVLRVPQGRPVRLLLTSRDVIHGFFVPAFRLKQDALPGRYTQTWFVATLPGTYPIYCSQYCGMSHSAMRAAVEVMDAAAFDRWREDEQARPRPRARHRRSATPTTGLAAPTW